MNKITHIGRPPSGRTSIGYLYELWKEGNISTKNAIKQGINRIANSTYPLGEDAYWKSVDKNGGMTWYAPHNLWRMVWHFIQGAAQTLPLILLANFTTPYLAIPAILGNIALAIYIERGDWIKQKKILYVKNITDVIDRSLGGIFIAWFVIYVLS